ncbi:MAG: metalloregulator ArsR/SmtB family transcription factor [Candidatus Thiodiazotropha sp.]|jgi:DNA-binding transcriptional ArsR family regulator
MLQKQELLVFFKALASEKRQQIVVEIFLDGAPHTVSEVAERSKIAMSTASTHLSILKRAKILTSQKVSKDVYYRGNQKYLAEVFRSLADRFSCC